jgi:hypothetical protein
MVELIGKIHNVEMGLTKRQGYKSRTEFSYQKMVEDLGATLSKNVPEFPQQVELQLPKLELPKL